MMVDFILKLRKKIIICNEAKEEDYNLQFEVNGTITSSVEGYELPRENNQSNFGVGYEYHIVDAENVLVRIEGLWIRYECANPTD